MFIAWCIIHILLCQFLFIFPSSQLIIIASQAYCLFICLFVQRIAISFLLYMFVHHSSYCGVLLHFIVNLYSILV